MLPDIDKAERQAISLYAVLDRDVCDFMDTLVEHDLETLQFLHDMLTMINPKHDADTRELNGLGAGMVRRHVEDRFGTSLKLKPVERLYPAG